MPRRFAAPKGGDDDDDVVVVVSGGRKVDDDELDDEEDEDEDEDDDAMDEAAEAYAAISSQISSWGKGETDSGGGGGGNDDGRYDSYGGDGYCDDSCDDDDYDDDDDAYYGRIVGGTRPSFESPPPPPPVGGGGGGGGGGAVLSGRRGVDSTVRPTTAPPGAFGASPTPAGDRRMPPPPVDSVAKAALGGRIDDDVEDYLEAEDGDEECDDEYDGDDRDGLRGGRLLPSVRPPLLLGASPTTTKFDGRRRLRSAATSPESYRRYHDALLSYYRRTSNVSERKAIVEEQMELSNGMITDESERELRDLEAEMTECDARLLDGLAKLCRDRAASEEEEEAGNDGGVGKEGDERRSRREGNVWSLLSTLRSLGTESILYDDDPDRTASDRMSIADAARRAASDVDASPSDVLDAAFDVGVGGDDDSSPPAPLILIRRKAVLDWLEECHLRDAERRLLSTASKASSPSKSNVMWPETLAKLGSVGRGGSLAAAGFALASSLDPDAPFAGSGGAPLPPRTLPESDERLDAELLRSCLALLRAGRLDDACELCRSAGQSWRAASWTGGIPPGRKRPRPPRQRDGKGEEEEEEWEEIGNPARALWKRRTWTIGRALMSGATAASSGANDNVDNVASSLQYEIAICALLSDDVETSLSLPVNRTWTSSLHVLLRGSMGRFEDEILRGHSANRRSVGKSFPFPGTEYEAEEEEQCRLTSSYLGRLDEGGTFEALRSSRVHAAVRDASSDPLRNAIASFVSGRTAAAEYLRNEASFLVSERAVGEGDEEEEEQRLRFAVHLALILDAIDTDFVGSIRPVAVPAAMAADVDDEGRDERQRERSARDALLLSYASLLASRADLWDAVALYASLLPPEDLVETHSEFWSNVEEDDDRRGLLRQAREFFPPGMDLVVLRRTVRLVLAEEDDDDDNAQGADARRRRRRKGRALAGPEASIAPGDVRKMNAVLWLCRLPEHAPDALVCANSLLRMLLLRDDDGDDGVRTARVFAGRYLPEDLVDVARERAVPSEGGEEATGDDDGVDDEEAEAAAGPPPVPVRDAAAEHDALRLYLDARDAHDRWEKALAGTSPVVAVVAPDDDDEEGGAGAGGATTDADRIAATTMERRSYLRRKRLVGRGVMEPTEEARARWTAVLSHPGGWLSTDDEEDEDNEGEEMEAGGEGPTAASEHDDEWKQEREARIGEMSSLRSKCLPDAAFRLREVLDRTATWMGRFADDAGRVLGPGGYDVLSSRAADGDDVVVIEAEEEGGDVAPSPPSSSPLTPRYWHERALELADVVARDENGIHASFRTDDLGRFLLLMAETAVKLMECSERKDD